MEGENGKVVKQPACRDILFDNFNSINCDEWKNHSRSRCIIHPVCHWCSQCNEIKALT